MGGLTHSVACVLICTNSQLLRISPVLLDHAPLLDSVWPYGQTRNVSQAGAPFGPIVGLCKPHLLK